MSEATTQARPALGPCANIHEAIVAVRKQVVYLQKRPKGSAPGLNYSFAAVEDLLQKLRPVLDEAGVCIYPVAMHLASEQDQETKAGGRQHNVKLEASYEFVHAGSMTKHTVQVLGEAADSGDKAVNKAATAALKMALRQAFLIETGDYDPDRHPSSGVVQQKAALLDKVVAAIRGAKSQEQLERYWAKAVTLGFEGQSAREALFAAKKEAAARLQAGPQAAPPQAAASNGTAPRQTSERRPREPVFSDF